MNSSGLGESLVNATFNVTETAIPAAVLALFILLGVPLNLFLLAVILHSRGLRSLSQNIFIISLTCANLHDSLLNTPLTLTIYISRTWLHGHQFCSLHSYSLSVPIIVISIGLMFLLWDRIVTIYNSGIPVMKTRIMVIYSWFHGLVLPVPIAVGVLDQAPYPFVCRDPDPMWSVYIIIMVAISFIIPVGISVSLLLWIVIKSVRQFVKNRSKETLGHERLEQQMNEKDEPSDVGNEDSAQYCTILYILFICLQLPYILTVFTNQLIESQHRASETLLIVVTVLRFSFILAMPTLTIFTRKPIWQKIKNFILCRKSNLIVDNSDPQPISRIAYNVPTLFATAEGLHFHNQKFENEKNLDEDATTGDVQIVHATKCDVMQSQEFLHDDTSDYDSSCEPFPSNGVSIVVCDATQIGVDSHDRSMEVVPETKEDEIVETSKSEAVDEVGSTAVENFVDCVDGHSDEEEVVNREEEPVTRSENPLNVAEETEELTAESVSSPKLENHCSTMNEEPENCEDSAVSTTEHSRSRTNSSSSVAEIPKRTKLKALRNKVASETRAMTEGRRVRRISASCKNDEDFVKPRKKKRKHREPPKPPPRLEPLNLDPDALFTKSVVPSIQFENRSLRSRPSLPSRSVSSPAGNTDISAHIVEELVEKSKRRHKRQVSCQN